MPLTFLILGMFDNHQKALSTTLKTTEAEKDIPVDRKLKNTDNLKILDVKNEVQILLASVAVFSGCLAPVCKNGLYQATRILPIFSLSLEPAGIWSNEFSLKFSH